eukprot:jgi/Botrbrau1/618/Bobra.0161s0012.1
MASRMVSESSYFYTQLYSAASFIETINTTSLTMDPQDFIAHMVAGGIPDMQLMANPASLASRSPRSPPPSVSHFGPGGGTPDSQYPTGDQTKEPLPQAGLPLPTEASERVSLAVPSVRELELEGAGLVVEAESQKQLQASYPFLYAEAGSLRVGDVQAVLQEYKELVLRYEALSRALQHRRTAGRAASLATPLAAAQQRDTPRAFGAPVLATSPAEASASPPAFSAVQAVQDPNTSAVALRGDSPRMLSGGSPGTAVRVPAISEVVSSLGNVLLTPPSVPPGGTPRETDSRQASGPVLPGVPSQGQAVSPLSCNHQPEDSGLDRMRDCAPAVPREDSPAGGAPLVPSTAASSAGALEDDEPDTVETEAEGGEEPTETLGPDLGVDDSLFAGLLCRQGELEDPSYSAGAGSVPFPSLSQAAEEGGAGRSSSGSGWDVFAAGHPAQGREQSLLGRGESPRGRVQSSGGRGQSPQGREHFASRPISIHAPSAAEGASPGARGPSHGGPSVLKSLSSDPYMRYLEEVRGKPFTSISSAEDEIAGGY